MNDARTASKVLQQISKELDGHIEKEIYPGLLNGYCGIALFYAYYYQLTGKQRHLDKVHYLMQKSMEALSEEVMILTHCSGVAGIAWCIQHLINAGFAEQEGLDDIFEEVDMLLGNYMKTELAAGNYDFLHQGLGVALYFLERLPHAGAAQYLEDAVQLLERSAAPAGAGLSWKDNFSPTSARLPDQDCFNLGLSHGVPAIISVLGRIHAAGIATARTRPLLEKSLQWLMAAGNTPQNSQVSLFPVMVTAGNEVVGHPQSRLGWCYGDLGIAVTLWNAGSCMQEERYKQHAYTIFEHIVTHRDNRNGYINDACLCHGSAGIAQAFRRAWLQSGDPLLLKGADHWLQQTLQMNTWKDGLAGFKYYAHTTYENNYSLLEGITGIGLALAAALDSSTDPAWDRCLLLS